MSETTAGASKQVGFQPQLDALFPGGQTREEMHTMGSPAELTRYTSIHADWKPQRSPPPAAATAAPTNTGKKLPAPTTTNWTNNGDNDVNKERNDNTGSSQKSDDATERIWIAISRKGNDEGTIAAAETSTTNPAEDG